MKRKELTTLAVNLKSIREKRGLTQEQVDPELWQRTQSVMTMNQIDSRQLPGAFFLLRGIIKCAACGKNYSGYKEREIKRYRCNGKFSYNGKFAPRCDSPNIKAEPIENHVWQKITEFLQRPETVREHFLSSANAGNKQALSLAQERAKLIDTLAARENEYSNLIDLVTRGAVRSDAGEKKLLESNAAISAIRNRIREIDQTSIDLATRAHEFLGIESRLREIATRADNASDETKREIVRDLVDHVSIEKDGSEAIATVHWNFDPCVELPRTHNRTWNLYTECRTEFGRWPQNDAPTPRV